VLFTSGHLIHLSSDNRVCSLSDGITNNDAIYDAANRFEVPSQYVYSLLNRERLIGKFGDLTFDGASRGWRIASLKRCDAIMVIAKCPLKPSYAVRPECGAALDG